MDKIRTHQSKTTKGLGTISQANPEGIAPTIVLHNPVFRGFLHNTWCFITSRKLGNTLSGSHRNLHCLTFLQIKFSSVALPSGPLHSWDGKFRLSHNHIHASTRESHTLKGVCPPKQRVCSRTGWYNIYPSRPRVDDIRTTHSFECITVQ